MATGMVFHTAHLRVRPDVIVPFKARIERHARTSVTKEPGCSRFDVHQERSDPTLFLLIECYDDEAAFQAHRSSAHFLAFREDVRDWVVERTWWYWDPVVSPA
jgi:(4S)-4-hydroxy-5-phosphonooxypentane-2,3-dione isomerase